MASHISTQTKRTGYRLPLDLTRRVLAGVAAARVVASLGCAAVVGLFGTSANVTFLMLVLVGVLAPWHTFLLREALHRAQWPRMTGPVDAIVTAGAFSLAPTEAWPGLIVAMMLVIAVESSRDGYRAGWLTAIIAVAAVAGTAVLVVPESAILSLAALGTGSWASVLVVGKLADEREVSIRRLGTAIDGSPSIVWEADANENTVAFVSGKVRHVLGYGPWELAHRKICWSDIVHPDDQHEVIDVTRIDEISWPHVREFRLRARNGDWVWMRDTVRAERRPDGGWALRGVATDITATKTVAERSEALEVKLQELGDDQRRDREQQRRDALHDPLTGLPNRSHLLEHMRMLLRRTEASDNPESATDVALLVLDLDLDQFKEINDTIGHHYSDEMLREVAARLADQRRGDDLLARLGGDEFAILLSPCGSERAEETAANIIKSIKRPLTLKGLQVQVGPSIGIARYPDDSTDTGKLLQKAEIAMYQAKTLRRGWTWYSQYDDRFSVRRLRLLGELPRALSKEELVVYYQPKIDLTIGTVVGVEALVRWQHPDLGMIAPDEFIELTEVSGLVTELTRQVLTRSVQQLTIWDEAGIHLDVAVNLSVRDFHDEGLVSFIVEALQTHNVAPERLMLEITESQVVDDVELATEVLLELSSLGIKTSIDDFGTGYSSLTHLRQLPVAEIKIDRSFVGQMATNHNDAVIVRSIVELGHNLDLEVVAEGVEDEWTLDNLRTLGCDRAQGYFFQRPVPGSEIPEFVHAVDAVPR